MDKTFVDIFLLGKYYNPASTHYNDEHEVICDRCNKNNLDISFGYLDKDICVNCANDVKDYIHESKCDNSTPKPISRRKGMRRRMYR